MGTNYYLKSSPTAKLSDADTMHIGKANHGWCFALHVIPEAGINDLNDWVDVLDDKEGLVYNEYDDPISVDLLIDIITQRTGNFSQETFDANPFLGSVRVKTVAQFLDINYAKIGPNQLLQCDPTKNESCVKNGDGTWDCITGDFC